MTTRFAIRDYGAPDRARYLPLPARALPGFPARAAGAKVLLDGTGATFGVLHIAVRDVDPAAYGEPDAGAAPAPAPAFEVWASVWYGDGVPGDHLEAEREHMVTEIINLTTQAQKDIESGAFVPPV